MTGNDDTPQISYLGTRADLRRGDLIAPGYSSTTASETRRPGPIRPAPWMRPPGYPRFGIASALAAAAGRTRRDGRHARTPGPRIRRGERPQGRPPRGGRTMPITGQGWEIHVARLSEQTRGTDTRTVGTYQVFHDGRPAAAVSVGGVQVPLSGTTAESRGPGQNATPATSANPSRILPGRYPLKTSGGPKFVTNGFRNDLQIQPQMPAVELRKTGNRTDILIHPGKDEFVSSIGCINLCTSLPNANEDIDYPGSRRRVIALIEDMKQFLGSVPAGGDVPILNAFAVIDGEPAAGGALPAATAGATIDGNAVAARNGVGVKSAAVKISRLDPAMAPVIAAVAEAATALGLPKPVITSGNDSGHKQGSLHFQDRALDFRGNNITILQGKAWRAKVAEKVGADYDALFETFANAANNHLHVEFDPD
jgi:hypothetical protein